MIEVLTAGSFDPPSSGHLDIIQRALGLCDKLHIGIGINSSKKPIFTVDERKELLKKITYKHRDSVEIHTVDGLVTDYAQNEKIDFLVRGIRNYADLDAELVMALMNRRLTGIETVFLVASASRVHVSSTLIKELARYNKKVENFVPIEIEDEVYERLFSLSMKNNDFKQ